jgi:crossover junction endodeoxyribonuclease RusA
MIVYLDLPNPPGVNQYYRNVRGRMVLSAKGRDYKTTVAFEVSNQCSIRFGAAKLKIKVQFHPATKGRVDLDGKLKSLLDALQFSGLFDDDANVDDLHIVRCEPVKGGRVTVIIEEITND